MRDHGTGTIHLRADGRWAGQVSLGTDEKGRRRRKTVYGVSKAEVRAKMTEARRAYEDGDAVVTDGRVTLAQYVEGYLDATLEAQVASGAVKRSTAEWYASMLRRHVLPLLGRKRLDAITPADVERLSVVLAKAGLSSSTRRGAYLALRKVLETAVRDGLVRRNPTASVLAPTVEQDEAAFLSVEQVQALIGAAEGWMRTAAVVLATTGIRRGELLALRWADLDLETGSARIGATLTRTKTDGLVRTEPKSRSSRRTVPLPSVAVEALRAHRAALGAVPLPSSPAFPSRTGGWMEPRNFTRQFQTVARKAGLDVSPHALRHSAATALIGAGVPLPVVSDLLGHSDIKITVGTYSHVIEDQRRQAADVLGAAFG